MHSSRSRHSAFTQIFIGAAMIVIGDLNAARPQLAYRLNSWQYKRRENWEPSRAGLIVARVGGAAFVVIGIVLVVVGISK